MKRIAVFVEGQTEVAFARRLFEEVAGQNKLSFAEIGPAYFDMSVAAHGSGEDEKPFVLLYNCGNDSKVKSEIYDQLNRLEASGYTSVLGLRDLYPQDVEDLDEIQAIDGTPSIPVEIIVSIYEIEAWFIGDSSHFARWDKKLTRELVLEKVGVDINNIDFESVRHPAQLLDQIYSLVGRGYKKRQHFVIKVVYCLDIEFFYLDMKMKSKSIERLTANIDEFLH
jgi:hypothetical protein